MSEADRKYREQARRQREVDERNKEAAAKAASLEEETLREEINHLKAAVLDLLERADYPNGELIQVSGKSGFWRNKRPSEVAAWLLHSGRRVQHDESTEFKFWLLSNGSLAFGAGSSGAPVDLGNNWWDNDISLILHGLKRLKSTLTLDAS